VQTKPVLLAGLMVGILAVGGALLWFISSQDSDSTRSKTDRPAQSARSADDSAASEKEEGDKPEVTRPAPSTPTIGSGRFQTLTCGAIRDTRTQMDWFIGPDRDMSWAQAKRWITTHSDCDGGWRLPTSDELLTLFDPESSAGTGFLTKGKRYPAKIDSVFDGIGEGAWAWTGEEIDKKRARGVNFYTGKPIKMKKQPSPYTVRAFAVRSVAAHERELASKRDHADEPRWCKKDLSKFSANVKLICSTPSLWGLEARNVELYFDLKRTLKDAGDSSALKANKKRLKAWLKERKACEDDVNCTAETYRRRIAELEGLSREAGY